MSYQQPSNNPYGNNQPAGNDPYASQPTNPYGQPATDPYAAQNTNPYGQPSADPYAAQNSQPYGQPSADPYATSSGQGATSYGSQPADPYGQASATPYTQPSATPYGQPSATPYGQPTDPYATQQGYGQQAMGGYGQSAPATGYAQPTADPYAANAGYADPYAQQAYGQGTSMEPYGYNNGGYGAAAAPRPEMSLGQSFKAMFQNFAKFTGRAGKSEWMAPGLTWLAVWILGMIVNGSDASNIINGGNPSGLATIVSLVTLVVFLPCLGGIIRRLHDQNKSGWFVLLGLIPLVGPIILFFWGFTGASDPAGARFDDPANPPKTGA